MDKRKEGKQNTLKASMKKSKANANTQIKGHEDLNPTQNPFIRKFVIKDCMRFLIIFDKRSG